MIPYETTNLQSPALATYKRRMKNIATIAAQPPGIRQKSFSA